jgi:tetratricopeptide (TPR) repeat protein
VPLRTISLFSAGSPEALVRWKSAALELFRQFFVTNCASHRSYLDGAVAAGEMRMNRFSSAVLIGIALCTSGNDPSFAAGSGDANENVASTATPEEAAIQAAAYKARLAARAAADEGFFLGRRGDFNAARKKFSQAIELDPKFSPAYRLRADACLKMSDWAGAIIDLDTLITLDPNDADIFNERGFARRQLGDLHGARDDFDRCITLGTDLPLAYGNRAEVELMLGDDSAAAADLAQAQSLAATMSDSPPASSTPSPRKNQTHHKTPGTGTSNNAKGTTR